ncbi:hypothetical protein ELG83_01055 [Rhizobium leguminosarum]|nr:hypothetical protein ELG92_01050 [Rhizobium leguminosarum]TBF55113.1 hypothetical protein ELG87_01055 [Rhizobium leguminosarum]TBF59801.1 hypothetical protein ELG90_01045 [Rhizobium leguminosarum]TBF71530.1 hypothetical protein ELG84_01050 [Rhizobium leguminosarum]TBF76206.1 hypothetical protein ELG89_01050 [Rhizobium leguminosarum]
MPCEGRMGAERSRHIPFAPFTGRRWRQPDEGLVLRSPGPGMSHEGCSSHGSTIRLTPTHIPRHA